MSRLRYNRMVTLPADEVEFLRKLGHGQVSRGISEAVALLKKKPKSGPKVTVEGKA